MPTIMHLAARMAARDTETACQDVPILLAALLTSVPAKTGVEVVLPLVASMLRGDQR